MQGGVCIPPIPAGGEQRVGWVTVLYVRELGRDAANAATRFSWLEGSHGIYSELCAQTRAASVRLQGTLAWVRASRYNGKGSLAASCIHRMCRSPQTRRTGILTDFHYPNQFRRTGFILVLPGSRLLEWVISFVPCGLIRTGAARCGRQGIVLEYLQTYWQANCFCGSITRLSIDIV